MNKTNDLISKQIKQLMNIKKYTTYNKKNNQPGNLKLNLMEPRMLEMGQGLSQYVHKEDALQANFKPFLTIVENEQPGDADRLEILK